MDETVSCDGRRLAKRALAGKQSDERGLDARGVEEALVEGVQALPGARAIGAEVLGGLLEGAGSS